MNLPAILPDAFLRCLDPAERKKLGTGQLSAEEALSKSQAKNERQLQVQIVNLLRLKGIEPLWHRTDKRSAATIGWPDITFSVRGWRTISEGEDGESSYITRTPFISGCAWEVKFDKGQLSKEQQQMHVRLSTSPNGWRIRVIRSVDEALSELKELGLNG